MAAIEAVSGKKCKHTAGKPSSFMMKVLSDSYQNIDKKKTCMVGKKQMVGQEIKGGIFRRKGERRKEGTGKRGG